MVPSRFFLYLTLVVLFQGMNSLKGQESYEEKLNGVDHSISMVFIEGVALLWEVPKLSKVILETRDHNMKLLFLLFG